MKKVVLFIAMSLDGYIADMNGKVDWLAGQTPHQDDMTSYHQFIQGIDTIVMGWNTYHQIVTELSPDEWFYNDLNSYIMTHRDVPSSSNICFVNKDICSLIKLLKQEEGKDIWICGGAHIINALMKENMIDQFHISIIPTILGNGIRLFDYLEQPILLKLIKTQNYNGITDLIYELR